MRKSDIEGLAPQQIQQKYAIPNVPTKISEVTIPKGTKVRVGITGPQPKFNNAPGGAVQYEILGSRSGVEYKLIGDLK